MIEIVALARGGLVAAFARQPAQQAASLPGHGVAPVGMAVLFHSERAR